MHKRTKKYHVGLTLLEVSISLIVTMMIILGLVSLITNNYSVMKSNNIAGLMMLTDNALNQYLMKTPVNFGNNKNEEVDINTLVNQGLLGKQVNNNFSNALKIYIRPIQQGKKTYFNGIEYLMYFDPNVWLKGKGQLDPITKNNTVITIGNKGGLYDKTNNVVKGLADAWKIDLADFYPDSNKENLSVKERRVYIHGVVDVKDNVSEITAVSCFDNISGHDCSSQPIEFNCNSGAYNSHNNEMLVFTYTGQNIDSVNFNDKNSVVNQQVSDSNIIYNFGLSTFCPITSVGQTISFEPVLTPINDAGVAGSDYEFNSAIKLTRVN